MIINTSMAVETFTYINSLDPNLPASSDGLVEGDNHIRGLKLASKQSFPNVSGPVTSTHTQLSNPILTTAPTPETAVYFTSSTTAANYTLTLLGRQILAQSTAANVLSLLGADAKYTINNITNPANIGFTGSVMASSFTVSSTAPTITFQDTDWGNRSLHNNGGLIGFLSNGGGWTFYCDNGGNTTQPGTAYAGNFYISSDPRLKKDIKPISAAAAEAFVRNVGGYTYRMIADDKLTSGVRSDEVKMMVPALVEENEGFDRVNYDAMQAYQLVHLRTLTDMFNDLSLEVRALRDQIAAQAREAIVPAPISGGP